MINAELIHAFPYEKHIKNFNRDDFEGVSGIRRLPSTDPSNITNITMAIQFFITKPLRIPQIWMQAKVVIDTENKSIILLNEIIQINSPQLIYPYNLGEVWGLTHSFLIPGLTIGPVHFYFYLGESTTDLFETCHGKTLVYMSEK